MSLEQYNVQTNPFQMLQKAVASKTPSAPKANLAHALILNAAHHAGVMEHLERTHQLTLEQKNTEADIAEKAAQATHGRNKELLQSINRSAEAGTGVKVGVGDFQASYTKKKPRVRPVAPVAEPAMPAAPEKPSPKFAHRDPVTRKITEYKDYPQEPLKPNKPKKAAPRKKK